MSNMLPDDELSEMDNKALIAEVRRLRAERDAFRVDAAIWKRECLIESRFKDEARAEVERMRAEIERLDMLELVVKAFIGIVQEDQRTGWNGWNSARVQQWATRFQEAMQPTDSRPTDGAKGEG